MSLFVTPAVKEDLNMGLTQQHPAHLPTSFGPSPPLPPKQQHAMLSFSVIHSGHLAIKPRARDVHERLQQALPSNCVAGERAVSGSCHGSRGEGNWRLHMATIILVIKFRSHSLYASTR